MNKTAIVRNIVLALIFAVCLCFTAATLYKQQTEKYRQQGYASALEQMVQASETNREISVTIGEKTVKFIVVTPAEMSPNSASPNP